ACACWRTISTPRPATATACSWRARSTRPDTASTATRSNATGGSKRPSVSIPLHDGRLVAAIRVGRRGLVLYARPASGRETPPVLGKFPVSRGCRRRVGAGLSRAGHVVALELLERAAGLRPVELAAPRHAAHRGDEDQGDGMGPSAHFTSPANSGWCTS